MKKTQIMAITGLGAGVIGSVAGAIITGKMYKGNKRKIEDGEFENEKEIKKAKLKTGITAVGTTLLAGLAVASGVGLAVGYTKDDKNNNNNNAGYLNEPENKNIEEDEIWLRALSEESDLVDELIRNNEEQNVGLHTMRDEIDEFVSGMQNNIDRDEALLKESERIQSILDDIDDSIDDIYDSVDNIDRNNSVVQGIIEQA